MPTQQRSDTRRFATQLICLLLSPLPAPSKRPLNGPQMAPSLRLMVSSIRPAPDTPLLPCHPNAFSCPFKQFLFFCRHFFSFFVCLFKVPGRDFFSIISPGFTEARLVTRWQATADRPNLEQTMGRGRGVDDSLSPAALPALPGALDLQCAVLSPGC